MEEKNMESATIVPKHIAQMLPECVPICQNVKIPLYMLRKWWSRVVHIQKQRRNRLTTERAGKLVYVYHNLRLLKGMVTEDVADMEVHDEGTESDESDDEHDLEFVDIEDGS